MLNEHQLHLALKSMAEAPMSSHGHAAVGKATCAGSQSWVFNLLQMPMAEARQDLWWAPVRMCYRMCSILSTWRAPVWAHQKAASHYQMELLRMSASAS